MGLLDFGKALDIAKGLASIEAQRDLMDTIDESMKLQTRVQELQAEVKDLQEKLKVKGALKFNLNAYWMEESEDRGPFCSRCWDKESKLIRFHQIKNNWYRCPACNGTGGTMPPTEWSVPHIS